MKVAWASRGKELVQQAPSTAVHPSLFIRLLAELAASAPGRQMCVCVCMYQ